VLDDGAVEHGRAHAATLAFGFRPPQDPKHHPLFAGEAVARVGNLVGHAADASSVQAPWPRRFLQKRRHRPPRRGSLRWRDSAFRTAASSRPARLLLLDGLASSPIASASGVVMA